MLGAPSNLKGPIPGRERGRIVCAGAPLPTKASERIETELGLKLIGIHG